MERLSRSENDIVHQIVTERPLHETLQSSMEGKKNAWDYSARSLAEIIVGVQTCEQQTATTIPARISSHSSDFETDTTFKTASDRMIDTRKITPRTFVAGPTLPPCDDRGNTERVSLTSRYGRHQKPHTDESRLSPPYPRSLRNDHIVQQIHQRPEATRTACVARLSPSLTDQLLSLEHPLSRGESGNTNNHLPSKLGSLPYQDTKKRSTKRRYKQPESHSSFEDEWKSKKICSLSTSDAKGKSPESKNSHKGPKTEPAETSSSGSSNESGYLGSSSSNTGALRQSSCSSPSSSPSEEGGSERTSQSDSRTKLAGDETSSLESSTELPEFGCSNDGNDNDNANFYAESSCRPSSSSSADESESSAEDTTASDASENQIGVMRGASTRSNSNASTARNYRTAKVQTSRQQSFNTKMARATRRKVQDRHQAMLQDSFKSALLLDIRNHSQKRTIARSHRAQTINGRPPILSLSYDLMAHCMTFLEPPQVHSLLTMPISKEWRTSFTMPQDLWKILCLTEPLKAKFEDIEDENSTEDDDCTVIPNMVSDLDIKHLLGRYRILYTSFVRCMKYLEKIKEDVRSGRPPSIIDYGTAGGTLGNSVRPNESLKSFLARARRVVVDKKLATKARKVQFSPSPLHGSPIGVTDNNDSVESSAKPQSDSSKPKAVVKYGHSQITKRLLGPAKSGEAGNVNLPWSCAIYSIVNWMVAFADVEGIQTMCLKTLPDLLEDESQRTTAQLAGLTDIVLRGMVLFPDSVDLHTAAFHTIVLLARPLGGKEGMLFHCSMVNSSGIFNKRSRSGKNGIAVMLDSMKRYENDEVLQSMSCWSLVNIALAPSQKAVLVKLGGISMVANAMVQHPFSAEVQFRALFALINLVIPSVTLHEDNETEQKALQESLGDVNNSTEKDMLDDNVGQITNLVVVAMKNFCSSESILNRACLVLHNLSLTDEYHTTLLWTPNCYQMLEWCLANHRSDHVLQQSAAGTLQRLQNTLSNDDGLRQRFASSLHSQHHSSLEEARREARLFVEQEERNRSPRSRRGR